MKGPVKEVTEYRYPSYYRIKGVYTYDTALKRETAYFYDERDSLQAQWLLQFDDHGRMISDALSGKEGTPCRSVEFRYDRHGRNIWQRDFVSSSCFGIFDWMKGGMSNWMTINYSIQTSRIDYTSGNRIAQASRAELSISRADTDKTLVTTHYEYHPTFGKLTALRTSRIRFMRGDRDSGAETNIYKYDSAGDPVKEIRMERSFGQETTDSVVTYNSYDSRHRLAQSKSYFRIDGGQLPAHPGIGVGASSVYSYDSLGALALRSSFNLYRQADGTETKVATDIWKPDPELEETPEYDAYGNVIRIRRGTVVLLSREIRYE